MSEDQKTCKSCGRPLHEDYELGRKEPFDRHCTNSECPLYQKQQ